MRLAGRITDWNDDKGFGFVVPHDGGTRAFVHINEFQRGSRRPVAGDLISYLPGVDARGRTNARQIRHAGQKIEAPRTPSRIPRAALGVCALMAGAAGVVLGLLPVLLVGVYFAMSALSYFIYRSDKIAARSDAQRTPEASLHLVDLLGGWPGALIASNGSVTRLRSRRSRWSSGDRRRQPGHSCLASQIRPLCSPGWARRRLAIRPNRRCVSARPEVFCATETLR